MHKKRQTMKNKGASMQPINPHNAHKNGHVFVVGMSGSGKTSAAKKRFIASTDQVIIFDPMGDYKGKLAGRMVRGYGNVRDFTQSLIAGRKTAQGFKIAYSSAMKPRKKILIYFAK